MTGPDSAEDTRSAGCAGGPRQHLMPLLPPGLRRPAAIIAAGCAVVTLVLAALVARTSRPDAVDHWVDSWLVAQLGQHHRALVLLMDLGEPVQVTIMTAALIAACLAVGRRRGAALAAISVPAAVVLTELVLKPLVGRTLGPVTVYPSGHASRAFTLAAVIVVLLLRPAVSGPGRVLRITAMAVAGLLATGVAVAMISLGYHYFSDTVGGAAVGIAVALATTFGLDRTRKASHANLGCHHLAPQRPHVR